MAVIQVSQARPGMVLAAEVRDDRGRLLVTSGRELTPEYLAALPGWGVTQVDVQFDLGATGLAGPLQEWAVQQAAEELNERFRRVDRSHPVISHIFTACTRRRAHRLQGEDLVSGRQS